MAAGIPLLFALDRELGIADGYAHDGESVEALRRHAQHLAATSGGEVSYTFDGSGDGGGGGGDGGGCGGGCGD